MIMKRTFVLSRALVVSLTCTATLYSAKFRHKPLFSGCKGMATGAEWQKNGAVLKRKLHEKALFLRWIQMQHHNRL